MYDPRWDDLREHDDGRARVYDERDRADHDPRDGLMHDLDLPRGDARELVIDRDHMYELNGEDSRVLAIVGAFRVVPERELGNDRDDARDRDTLDHLRDEGLIRTTALNEHEKVPSADGLLVVDYSAKGQPMGVEITAPLAVPLERLNSLLVELGEPPLPEQDYLPLRAA